ncbi:hypothetical protein F2Q70_00008943 [Brassica cretica]|uniref:Uncharacterized protein n=1 Tax=Brassica cretica TaxID=69181 RepID=A0A8S9M3M7_BRACR|nr:hypothetical protein F2Q70_00008943 [Brassica cretica]
MQQKRESNKSGLRTQIPPLQSQINVCDNLRNVCTDGFAVGCTATSSSWISGKRATDHKKTTSSTRRNQMHSGHINRQVSKQEMSEDGEGEGTSNRTIQEDEAVALIRRGCNPENSATTEPTMNHLASCRTALSKWGGTPRETPRSSLISCTIS